MWIEPQLGLRKFGISSQNSQPLARVASIRDLHGRKRKELKAEGTGSGRLPQVKRKEQRQKGHKYLEELAYF
jgi:hypothetical protein